MVKPAQTGVQPTTSPATWPRYAGLCGAAGGPRADPRRGRPLPRPAVPRGRGPPQRAAPGRPAAVATGSASWPSPPAGRWSRGPAGCWSASTRRARRSPTWRSLRAAGARRHHAGLGTLNHTALTLEAMAHRGLELAGVVIGAWPAEPDLAARSNVARPRDAGRPTAGRRAARGSRGCWSRPIPAAAPPPGWGPRSAAASTPQTSVRAARSALPRTPRGGSKG